MTETTGHQLFRLLELVGHREVFFGIWAVMVCGFILLMYSFYRSTTRRNFREPGEMGARVIFDPRLPRADADSKDTGIAKK